MKRVFFLNIKGGVGKTTLSNELAWSLDRTHTPYSYFDLDEQGGSPHTDAQREDATIQIADTPSAALDEDLREWARMATVVVIPTRSGRLDLCALKETLETVKEANPEAQIIILQNGWNRWTTAREFGKWLQENGHGAPIVQVPQSEMIAQATTLGQSVRDRAPRSKAAEAMLNAVNAIRAAAGIEKEGTTNGENG